MLSDDNMKTVYDKYGQNGLDLYEKGGDPSVFADRDQDQSERSGGFSGGVSG